MSIEIPKIIKRNCHYDKRGYLQEIYLKRKEKKIFKFSLITSSKKNVFRGFHFQLRKQQAKLVYIVKGKILDIVIDLRKKSKRFGKVYKFRLKEKDILYKAANHCPVHNSLSNNIDIKIAFKELAC